MSIEAGGAVAEGWHTEVIDVPCPQGRPGQLLIQSRVSLISAGTERMLLEFGKAGMSGSQAARRFGSNQATTDADNILANGSIDAVVVVTRHDCHADYVCRALEAGKHVFVEKPLATDTERPVTVDVGTNMLVGTDPDRLVAETNRILHGNWPAGGIPELWDGQAGWRLATILAAEAEYRGADQSTAPARRAV